MFPNPPSKRMATQRVASPLPPKIVAPPPWQILHTHMNYYWEIYLRILPGRQLIVCSTLYVYALQNLFRGQKMTKNRSKTYPEMHYMGTVFKYYVSITSMFK